MAAVTSCENALYCAVQRLSEFIVNTHLFLDLKLPGFFLNLLASSGRELKNRETAYEWNKT